MGRWRAPWFALGGLFVVWATGWAMAAEAWPAIPADYRPSSVEIVASPGLLLFGIVGTLVVVRLGGNPIGWILFGIGAAECVGAAGLGYGMQALFARSAWPGEAAALWLVSTGWAPVLLVATLLLVLLFPDGRLPSRAFRPWAFLAIGIGMVATLGTMFASGPNYDVPVVDNPLGIPGFRVLQYATLAMPISYGVAIAAVVVRRRRAVGDEREQMNWLLYAVSLVAVGLGGSFLLGEWGALSALITLGPLVLLPVAIGVAVLKYRLYDIDVIVNRTLVYGGLTVAVLAAYALTVVTASAISPVQIEWRQSVLVAALFALLAYPLREWLQRAVNRLMYGDRDAPYAAMSRLARLVADTVTPGALLPIVAQAVAQGLRVPYVAIEPIGGPPVLYGRLRGEPHRIPLEHQGVEVGTLVLGPRAPGARFSTADRRLLHDVAHQVAAAISAVRLTTDLQHSRERLVLAREEERRRLRRDLHDGLGSTLAGLTLYAGNARNAVRVNPAAAEAWLAQLEDGIRAVVKDVRQIVYDMRPPALDELGLVGALRQVATSLPIQECTVTAEPHELPGLPAAVEVAAYRIASEAMLNAARHACATRCTVRIVVGDTLTVEVVDDGSGLPEHYRAGVGLLGIQERAAELGGRCEVGPGPDAGTLVRATLPLESP